MDHDMSWDVFYLSCLGYRGIIIIYICWWTEDGRLRRKRTIILWSQNLTLYFMLQKQYRLHKLWNETLCVVWLRLMLQQLPAVCEKCYFPLAEARKKRKMFSHTPLGAWWNQGVIEWCRLFEHIFVVAQRGLTVSHPPSPFMFISIE
jgi:hypothetical protein